MIQALGGTDVRLVRAASRGHFGGAAAAGHLGRIGDRKRRRGAKADAGEDMDGSSDSDE